MERKTYRIREASSPRLEKYWIIEGDGFFASGSHKEIQTVFTGLAALGGKITDENGLVLAGTLDEMLRQL